MVKSQLTEKAIQRKIFDYLRKSLKEGIWFKIPQGKYSMIGISDIIGCFHGHFVALEVKRPGKKLTKLQSWFQNKVEESGGTASTVCSVEETKEVISNVRIRIRLSEAGMAYSSAQTNSKISKG
jgi:hypothetical protein